MISFCLFRASCVSAGKESACNVGELGSIPRLGRTPGGGHGKTLQYSCLENTMGREAWQSTVHKVTKSDVCVCVSVSCFIVSDSLQPIDCIPPSPSLHGILQARTLEWVAISFSKRNYRKKESEVAQAYPTLCDPMDCSLPGSFIYGIFQARVLEWVAISFSHKDWYTTEMTQHACMCLELIFLPDLE